MKFIGDNLRKFRTEAGLSRQELARKIIKANGKQINARTILNWENGGKPDADLLAEMSMFFQKELILFFTPITYHNALESRISIHRVNSAAKEKIALKNVKERQIKKN